MKRVEEDTKCVLKFNEDTSSRLLRKDEELCVVLGKLEDVQAMLGILSLMKLWLSTSSKYTSIRTKRTSTTPSKCLFHQTM